MCLHQDLGLGTEETIKDDLPYSVNNRCFDYVFNNYPVAEFFLPYLSPCLWWPDVAAS